MSLAEEKEFLCSHLGMFCREWCEWLRAHRSQGHIRGPSMLLLVAWHFLAEHGACCTPSENSMRDSIPQFDLMRSSTYYEIFHFYDCPGRCSISAAQQSLQIYTNRLQYIDAPTT